MCLFKDVNIILYIIILLIARDLIEAEVVNSTNSRFEKLIFIVKEVTFI